MTTLVVGLLYASSLLAATPPLTPATVPNHPEIYGGAPVAPGAWPFVVGVQAGNRMCTGTVIAADLVLTAAHCMPDGVQPEEVTITFGDDLDVPDAELPAVEVANHPEYCADGCLHDRYDFAYVRLGVEVFLDLPVLVTDQQTYDEVMGIGDDVILVGYGLDEADVSGIKRQVITPITSYSPSGKEFGAGGGGKDSCQGDSGGPALIDAPNGTVYLAGVLSRGYDCGDGGIYGNPYDIACWLDVSASTSLAPGCPSCDCVDLGVHRQAPASGCGCSATLDARGSAPSLIAVFLLGGMLGRRRRTPS